MRENVPGDDPEVQRLLEQGEFEAAGERLLLRAERDARADPVEARSRWVEHSDRGRRPAALESYLEWGAGVVLHLAGRPAESRAHLENAVSVFRGIGRRDLADRVGILRVDVLGELGERRAARALAKRLQKAFTAAGDRRRTGLALAAEAGVEDAADRILAARELWHRALRQLERGQPEWLMVRGNLANGFVESGQPERAIAIQQELMDDADRRGLEALKTQAATNLAQAEFLAGHLDRALGRWHEVIARSQAAGDAAAELFARADLAAAEATIGALDAARNRVEGLAQGFRDHGMVSESIRAERLESVVSGGRRWRNLFDRWNTEGLELQAALLCVDAASAGAAVGQSELHSAASVLRRAGYGPRALTARALAADRAAGAGCLSEARELAQDVVRDRNGSAWSRLIARSVLARAEPELAGRHLAVARRAADRLLGRLTAPADRQAFLRTRTSIYLESLAHLLGTGRSRDRRRALDLVHRFRTGWLLDELGRRATEHGDPDVGRWATLRRRLATLLSEMEGDNEPRLRRSGLRVRGRIEELDRELAEVEQRLARRWGGVIAVQGHERIAERVAALLPERHLMVEYFLHQDDLVIFHLGRGGLRTEVVSGIGRRLEWLAASVRFHLDARPWTSDGRGSMMDRAFGRTLEELGEILLGRLPLGGADWLWVAPHGVLHGVPWSALPLSDGLALVDRMGVTLAPGAAAVATILGRDPQPARNFGLAAAPIADLPDVEAEVRDLERIVPDAATIRNASRDDLIELLRTKDAVHLAGHAMFLDGVPSASGLRLSDGFLTVHDVAAQVLGARFVSFGVCSATRLSDTDPNLAEGLLRALMAGGVRTVVGPVAPVQDHVARRFSVALYRRMADSWSPGEAWRQAVVAVRERHSAPAIWGAYQLYGDPRAVIESRK